MNEKYLIIHTSDSVWGNAVEIDSWHRKRKFDMIGYNYVILNGCIASESVYDPFMDGLIETGRDIQLRDGAHVRGYNNSVGVCLIGESGHHTDAQLRSLKKIMLKYIELKIKLHSDLDPKKPNCPGFNIEQLLWFIKEEDNNE